jgi:hypothetical protein
MYQRPESTSLSMYPAGGLSIERIGELAGGALAAVLP